MSCSRFIWITNSSDHRRVWTAYLLHTKWLPNLQVSSTTPSQFETWIKVEVFQHEIFRKTNISYPLIFTRKKCSFFGKFGMLCLPCSICFEICLFAILMTHWGSCFKKSSNKILKNEWLGFVYLNCQELGSMELRNFWGPNLDKEEKTIANICPEIYVCQGKHNARKDLVVKLTFNRFH